jgi:hypothetical protein
MGAGATSDALKRADAGELIGVVAIGEPRVDMGDALRTTAVQRRVEVGVEHAGAAAELQLQAPSFADLQRGSAEPLHEFAGGEPKDVASDLGGGGQRGLRLRRWCRTAGATGKDQDKSEG